MRTRRQRRHMSTPPHPRGSHGPVQFPGELPRPRVRLGYDFHGLRARECIGKMCPPWQVAEPHKPAQVVPDKPTTCRRTAHSAWDDEQTSRACCPAARARATAVGVLVTGGTAGSQTQTATATRGMRLPQQPNRGAARAASHVARPSPPAVRRGNRAVATALPTTSGAHLSCAQLAGERPPPAERRGTERRFAGGSVWHGRRLLFVCTRSERAWRFVVPRGVSPPQTQKGRVLTLKHPRVPACPLPPC